jgi:hypothetical protein
VAAFRTHPQQTAFLVRVLRLPHGEAAALTVSHLIPIAMSYGLVPACLTGDPGRTGQAGAHCRHLRSHRHGDQHCRQFSRFSAGAPSLPPVRCRGGSDGWACLPGRSPDGCGWLSPASSVMSGISRMLHRLLRFYAEHGHRPTPAPASKIDGVTQVSTGTELTKGRIDPLRRHLAPAAASSTMSGRWCQVSIGGAAASHVVVGPPRRGSMRSIVRIGIAAGENGHQSARGACATSIEVLGADFTISLRPHDGRQNIEA